MGKKSRRLSLIDLLPDEALEDISWAEEAFRSKRITQRKIYTSFCQRLSSKGIDAPSSGSFHRWTMGLRQNLQQSRSEPFQISDRTRQLLSLSLRSLANDLDGGVVPTGALSLENVDAILNTILGVPQ